MRRDRPLVPIHSYVRNFVNWLIITIIAIPN